MQAEIPTPCKLICQSPIRKNRPAIPQNKQPNFPLIDENLNRYFTKKEDRISFRKHIKSALISPLLQPLV
jgi:hypothetical protein